MSRRRVREEKAARRMQMLQRYAQQRARNAAAKPGPLPFALVLDNLKAGYNVAKIFRSAEAFGAAEIHLVNIGPFDPAPAKGAFRKVPARFHETFDTAYADLGQRGFTLFALLPDAAESLPETRLPGDAAFVFGHEEHGLSFDPANYPDIRPLRIPQAGTMQSLNVSVAASIAMYEYLCQRRASPAQ